MAQTLDIEAYCNGVAEQAFLVFEGLFAWPFDNKLEQKG